MLGDEDSIKRNVEIDQALKEFEKSNALPSQSQAPQVSQAPQAAQVPPVTQILNDETSGIKFQEDKFQGPAKSFTDESPKMVRLVIRWSGGAIKDENQANMILFGFVVLCVVLTLLIIFSGNFIHKGKYVSAEDIINAMKNSGQ